MQKPKIKLQIFIFWVGFTFSFYVGQPVNFWYFWKKLNIANVAQVLQFSFESYTTRDRLKHSQFRYSTIFHLSWALQIYIFDNIAFILGSPNCELNEFGLSCLLEINSIHEITTARTVWFKHQERSWAVEIGVFSLSIQKLRKQQLKAKQVKGVHSQSLNISN